MIATQLGECDQIVKTWIGFDGAPEAGKVVLNNMRAEFQYETEYAKHQIDAEEASYKVFDRHVDLYWEWIHCRGWGRGG